MPTRQSCFWSLSGKSGWFAGLDCVLCHLTVINSTGDQVRPCAGYQAPGVYKDEDQACLRGLAVVRTRKTDRGERTLWSESVLWKAGKRGPLQGWEGSGELFGGDS